MTTDQTPEPTEPGGRRNRLILAIVGGLVALALIGVGVWAAAQPSAPAGSASPSATPSRSASASPTPSPTAPTPSASASASAPAAPTVPAPDPSLDSADEVQTDYDNEQPVTPALAIKVSAIDAIQGEADEPGEIAGPSLRFKVDFVNSSDAAISLRDVAINVDYGADKTPALELRTNDTSPVPAEVGPGSTVSGTYVFNVPKDGRDQVRLLVFTTVDDPVIAFSGPAPR